MEILWISDWICVHIKPVLYSKMLNISESLLSISFEIKQIAACFASQEMQNTLHFHKWFFQWSIIEEYKMTKWSSLYSGNDRFLRVLQKIAYPF